MNNKLFKILSICLLAINIIYFLFLITSIILSAVGVFILNNLQLIILIVTLALNVLYIIYLTIYLVVDKRRKDKR